MQKKRENGAKNGIGGGLRARNTAEIDIRADYIGTYKTFYYTAYKGLWYGFSPPSHPSQIESFSAVITGTNA